MAPSNAALRTRFIKFARKAWRPVTEPADAGAGGSLYSGLPLLQAGEAWPKCGCCGKEMQLFLQLDLASIPGAAQQVIGLSSGKLQFFYCTRDCDNEGWKPFSKAHFLRVLPAGVPASQAAAIPESIDGYFPAKLITAWTEFEDFPSPEEPDALPEMSEDEYDAYYVSEPYLNAEGDKLCGWPNWVQEEEYPACPGCGRQMQLVYQLDNFTEARWMWGDAGIGHVTQCPEHRDVLAFGWACS